MDWYSLPSVMKAIRDGSLDPKNYKNIEEAIYRGSEELMEFLLTFEPNIPRYNQDGDSLLHVAVKHGNPYMFERIVKLGFNVNDKNREGMTPIMIASKLASTPCVNELLELGADPCIRNGVMNVFTLGWTPAVYSIYYRRGLRIEEFTDRPMHLLANLTICSKEQDPEVIEWIQKVLDRYDINARDELGETPLHKTMCQRGNRRVTEFLLERGANPNIQNNEGQTPLMKALDTKDRFWMNPLAERQRVVTPLLKGVDLTLRDDRGKGYILYMIMNEYILDIFDRIVKSDLQYANLDWTEVYEEKSILDMVLNHKKARIAVKSQLKRLKTITHSF